MKKTYCDICGKKMYEERGWLGDSVTCSVECMYSPPKLFKVEYADVCDECKDYLDTQFKAVFDTYKLKSKEKENATSNG